MIPVTWAKYLGVWRVASGLSRAKPGASPPLQGVRRHCIAVFVPASAFKTRFPTIHPKDSGKNFMAFFNSAVGVLQTLVVALGAGLGIWGDSPKPQARS